MLSLITSNSYNTFDQHFMSNMPIASAAKRSHFFPNPYPLIHNPIVILNPNLTIKKNSGLFPNHLIE